MVPSDPGGSPLPGRYTRPEHSMQRAGGFIPSLPAAVFLFDRLRFNAPEFARQSTR
jgi:hypothetical protein